MNANKKLRGLIILTFAMILAMILITAVMFATVYQATISPAPIPTAIPSDSAIYDAVGNYCGNGVVWTWDYPNDPNPNDNLYPAVCHRESGDQPVWVDFTTLEVTPR